MKLETLRNTGKKTKSGGRIVLVKCFCGKEFECYKGHMVNKSRKSCGCIIKNGTKDGLTRKHNKEYRNYMAMIYRCYNPSRNGYERYGGKGIKVCDRWLGDNGFTNYLQDMGTRPSEKHQTVDRIDSTKNYSPDNCRWATYREQNLNILPHKNKSSKWRGVGWDKFRNKWKASLKIDGKTKFLGRFINELDAKEAALEVYYNHYKQWPPEYKELKI